MESALEGARLEAKTDRDATRSQLELLGLQPGMAALDVGCGTGAGTRVMAELAAPARVVGVDASASRLCQARKLADKSGQHIEFFEGEATRLPLASDAFDFTYSRFLFEYLDDPERALSELIRVTRPGGIVAVADLDAQLENFYPLHPATEEALAEALRCLQEGGFDPRVGRKLFTWFYRQGLSDISVQVGPHQLYAGGLPPRDLLNWTHKLETGARRLSERLGNSARWHRLSVDLLAEMQKPDAFYYSTVILMRGTVPNE